jgi:hypothetical protein
LVVLSFHCESDDFGLFWGRRACACLNLRRAVYLAALLEKIVIPIPKRFEIVPQVRGGSAFFFADSRLCSLQKAPERVFDVFQMRGRPRICTGTWTRQCSLGKNDCEHCLRLGLTLFGLARSHEGIIVKAVDSLYNENKRGNDWIKVTPKLQSTERRSGEFKLCWSFAGQA